MAKSLEFDSALEAYKHFRMYPKTGPRDAHNGVPALVTLGKSAFEGMFEIRLNGPITSETKTFLAGLLKAANPEEDRSIPEIKASYDTVKEVEKAALEAIEDRYPSLAESDERLTGSPNYSTGTLCAIAAVSYDLDPLALTRERLDGETKPLGDSGGD